MKAIELEKKIVKLHESANFPCDRLDLGITLTVALNDQQRVDLSAMIDRLTEGNEPMYVLAQVVHDLNGLKGLYLEPERFVGFSPRSTGYAAKTAV